MEVKEKENKTEKTEIIEKEIKAESSKKEKVVETTSNSNNKSDNFELVVPNDVKSDVLKIFGILTFFFIFLLLAAFCTFSIINTNNDKIISGISIKGIDVSGLSKEEAKQKISNYINSSIPEEIKLRHNDFETSFSTSQLSVKFKIDEAVNIAYDMGRDENVFKRNLKVIQAFLAKIDIDPGFSFDKEQLKHSLQDISNKLPDKVIESSYYIEDNNLIITKGSNGYIVDVEESTKGIIKNIDSLNLNTPFELIVKAKSPAPIDLDKIYAETYKKPVDSYFTQNPYTIYPSENGLDFAISLNEARALLQENKNEYKIPLKVLYPEITTSMIGDEAFPDLLSDFSTNYDARNVKRTTNLILAAEKIDGTVLLPGEVFSYNKVVGERTIEAGYQEAPIYVNGKVEDGLGGGICQITTTLYNAALYADLEIIERSNHQFVPTYANASRDATVVYGVIDFKMKNNRNYPIKLMCTVEGGVANFKIYGLATEDDYEVQITSRITGTTATAIYSQAYKTLYKDGEIVSSEIISKDTYKRH